MASNSEIMLAFRAEAVLGADAEIFQRITNLCEQMAYTSDGQRYSFEDYFELIRNAIDEIPKLELETDIIPGTENQYSITLGHAMERIVDDCDRIACKAVHFQGRLREAERQITNLKAEFVAWYMLVSSPIISNLEDVKLPLKDIRALAEAEFSRLMGNIDMRVTILIDDVKIECARIASHKSAQKEKHGLGIDQINISWTSVLPSYGGAISEREIQPEEEDEDVPSFVSRKNSTQISSNSVNLGHTKPGETVVIRHTENMAKASQAKDIAPSGFKKTLVAAAAVIKNENNQPIIASQSDLESYMNKPNRKKFIFDDEDGI